MVQTEQGIRGADVFFTLNRQPVASGNEIPLGGKPTTPEEESRMGAQLRRELSDYKAPIIEARTRVYQAMSGRATYYKED